MKRLQTILFILIISQVVKSQNNFGIYDLVTNSENIFLLKAIGIDSLDPVHHHSTYIQKNRLSFDLMEDYSEHKITKKKSII